MSKAIAYSILLLLCLPIHGRPHSFAERTGIDGNWWGTCLTPTASSATCAVYYWSTCNVSEKDAGNIEYAFTWEWSGGETPDFTVDCSAGTGDIAGKKVNKGRAAEVPLDTIPTCQNLLAEGRNYITFGQCQQCHDTLEYFIETCPLWQRSWSAFSSLTAAVGCLGADSATWAQYRGWLESVLYLNTVDPEYFCACVEAIGGTFDLSDTTAGAVSRGTNYGLAVMQWLIQNTSCDTPVLAQQYTRARQEQYYDWSQDSSAYKLDTTLPTMKQLGLDSILKLHNQQGVVTPTIYASDLQSFSLSENPFSASTMLRCNLSKAAYIRTEVYDELGRTIIGDGTGRVYDPGLHQQQLDLSKFASGAYYLRISAGDGETRTIKMVRRE